MKKLNEILEKNANELPLPSWTSKTPAGKQRKVTYAADRKIPELTKTLVNMLFARFMAIYGHKFKSTFETENEINLAKREWALSLEGYSEHELVQAINLCKETLSWMPSIAEFISLLNEVRGHSNLPSAWEAYKEACHYSSDPLAKNWTMPIIYYAGKQTGWFILRTQESDRVFPQFKHNYQILIQRLQEGESLDIPIPKALPQASEQTTFIKIQEFAKKNNLEESDLYYMTKPFNSGIRHRLRQQLQQQLDNKGQQLLLPE